MEENFAWCLRSIKLRTLCRLQCRVESYGTPGGPKTQQAGHPVVIAGDTSNTQGKCIGVFFPDELTATECQRVQLHGISLTAFGRSLQQAGLDHKRRAIGE